MNEKRIVPHIPSRQWGNTRSRSLVVSPGTGSMSEKSTDRGRSTRRKTRHRSPSTTKSTPSPSSSHTSPSPASIATAAECAPLPRNEGLKNLFVTMLCDRYRKSISGNAHLMDPRSMDLVVKPIIKHVTGESPAIITCLLQYSEVSLFHSIFRFVTGQVEQLHFQYADVMTLLNDSNLYRLMNNQTIAFRTECMQAFIADIMPPDQIIAANAEIIILQQDSIQLVILYAIHGAANSVAVKIHGEGKYSTCTHLLINLSILQMVCCRFLCHLPKLAKACIEQHHRTEFLPEDGRDRLLRPPDKRTVTKYFASVRKKTERAYWAFFMAGIRQENNFGVVPIDDAG